uniref:Putative secreted protein n=1 Tax=Anopheles darlingi TaxID=43151 RepID=A0A2M4DEF8_ANODA
MTQILSAALLSFCLHLSAYVFPKEHKRCWLGGAAIPLYRTQHRRLRTPYHTNTRVKQHRPYELVASFIVRL